MIRTINTKEEFDNMTEAWRRLQTNVFGPLAQDRDAVMMIVESNGEAVAYLVAEESDLWHIEVKDGARGNGYAHLLCEAAQISFAWEVCSDEGAALCESLGIDFDDCR